MENRGKILVEIPDVYELVNVAIALTSFGREHGNFVYHESPYHQRVQDWFADHTAHPFVAAVDTLLTRNRGRYAGLEMNGYSFLFDERGSVSRHHRMVRATRLT